MSNAETPAEHAGGNPATPTTGPLADLPARIRVHALAKLLESHSRDVLAKLAELGESVRSAQSSVTREVALKVAEAFTPERCLWGSDWPYLRATERIDYGLQLKLMEQLFPDAGERRKLFWDTPRRLLGWSD